MTTGAEAGEPARPRRARWWAPLLGGLVLLQLVVLYAPSAGAGGQVPHLDKAVHVAVFAGPVLVALAWRRLWAVAGVMAAHAPVSELVQARLLPDRNGDGWDVVADITGIVLAVGLFLVGDRVRR